MKILFFGIYEIGVKTLEELLLLSTVEVVAVITKHDSVYQSDSVIELAQKHNLLWFQAKSLNCEYVINTFKQLDFDLIVVAGFHLKIPHKIIKLAKIAAVNIHDSLLPDYRGPNASKWCIINGESKAGVTIHYLTDKLDDGEIIAQREILISETDTSKTLFSKVSLTSAKLLAETVQFFQEEGYFPFIQKRFKGSYYSYPTYDETIIKWGEYDALKISRLVRGLNPSPGACMEYKENYYRVLEVEILDCKTQNKSGTIVSISNKYIDVSTLTHDIRIRGIVKRINQEYSINQFVIDSEIEVSSCLSI